MAADVFLSAVVCYGRAADYLSQYYCASVAGEPIVAVYVYHAAVTEKMKPVCFLAVVEVLPVAAVRVSSEHSIH